MAIDCRHSHRPTLVYKPRLDTPHSHFVLFFQEWWLHKPSVDRITPRQFLDLVPAVYFNFYLYIENLCVWKHVSVEHARGWIKCLYANGLQMHHLCWLVGCTYFSSHKICRSLLNWNGVGFNFCTWLIRLTNINRNMPSKGHIPGLRREVSSWSGGK